MYADQSDNKFRDFFFKLNEELKIKEEEEEKVDEVEVEEAVSGQSDMLTPLSGATPETIQMKNNEWTIDMRERVVKHLETMGWDGVKVPGTNYNVAYRGPDERKKYYREYSAMVIVNGVYTNPICEFLGMLCICCVLTNKLHNFISCAFYYYFYYGRMFQYSRD